MRFASLTKAGIGRATRNSCQALAALQRARAATTRANPPRSPGQVERYMEHTRSDSYDSISLAYPNKPSESGGATLPEDDTMDGRPEMARTLQAGSVGLGSTDELPEPPRLPRPTTIRPPMVESSSTKTETRRSLMPALAPPASPNSSSSVYVTEHDESPPTNRGLRRLSQAVSTMKLMNKATKLGSATTSEAFLKSRALTRMIGVKGTGHQARGAAPLTCSLRCQWRGLPRATTQRQHTLPCPRLARRPPTPAHPLTTH